MVQNPDLRLYTSALKIFEEFQTKVNESAPHFHDEGFVKSLSLQIDQLRGRELPVSTSLAFVNYSHRD
jgi:hypothetical protein